MEDSFDSRLHVKERSRNDLWSTSPLLVSSSDSAWSSGTSVPSTMAFRLQ